MRIAFYLAHPAHFHLFKNVVNGLSEKKHSILVLYNEKDVLHHLITKESIFNKHKIKIDKISAITNIQSSLGLKIQFIQKTMGAFLKLLVYRPNIVVGTPILISLVGKLLRYNSIIVNEDDFDIIQNTADLGYPFATGIICPEVCRTGQFDNKCLKYQGYHELAYLHPNHFNPSREIVESYFSTDRPYFLMRFAKLSAHHDSGIRGISNDLARNIISILSPKGRVYITSERELDPEFESYRVPIDPFDIHHVIAFASLYIGDSQTMAAEAGILGTPFIRFNDFVGKISYLAELEDKYKLGYGISPDNSGELLSKVEELSNIERLKGHFAKRRQRMLGDKIDVAMFLRWIIDNYPQSFEIMKENSHYQYTFR